MKIAGKIFKLAGVSVSVYHDSENQGCGIELNGVMYFKSIRHDWQFFNGRNTVDCSEDLKSVLDAWASM